MGKKLNTFVTVHDEDFVAHTFGPGEKVPAWAKKAITNPNVWAEEESTSGDEDDENEGDADGDEEPTTSGTGSSDAVAPSLPPRGGAGSGADAWRAYGVAAAKARGLEIEIPGDATKTDIIEALKGAGIPVE